MNTNNAVATVTTIDSNPPKRVYTRTPAVVRAKSLADAINERTERFLDKQAEEVALLIYTLENIHGDEATVNVELSKLLK